MANVTIPSVEGNVPFQVGDEIFYTYYKVFGDLKNRKHTPLVALHGGPGLVHDYLVPLSTLAGNPEIPVILYDQIGNGKSTHLREKPKSFWTIDLFIDEFINLLRYLQIEDEFHVYGHSWGAILGVEYELRRRPAGLRKLIISNSLASMELWNKSNMQLMQGFPKEVQEGLMVGLADIPKYLAALEKYHAVHGCVVKPSPVELKETLTNLDDPTVSVNIGELGTWTCIDRLDQVRVSTLLLNGVDDIAQDFVVRPFFDKIPKIKWFTFAKSSHTPFYEERDKFMNLVAEFLMSS
ncbi:proline iminopeptidase [Abortiporus biennis]|nr:proline iminopeptidase [Abortiporus biennis]